MALMAGKKLTIKEEGIPSWAGCPKALRFVLGLRPNRTINKAREVAPKPGTAIRGEKDGPFLC